MSEVTAALIVAIVGAATGIAALAWSVVTWRLGGPGLTITQFSYDFDGHLRAKVWNTGRADAYISHFWIMWIEVNDAGDEEMLHSGAADVVMDRHPIPAHGSTNVTISNLHKVLGGLLSCLESGGKVALVAWTGPLECVSAPLNNWNYRLPWTYRRSLIRRNTGYRTYKT